MVLLVLSLWALDAQAVVVKKLRLESVPSGAEVYLLQGMKKVHLGTTPLEYQAEFHSEISILRILFKKRAYKDVTLEVSASKDQVIARLESSAIAVAADPHTHKDAHLRKIQQEINPIINKTVPKLLGEKVEQEFDLAAPIKVQGTGEKVFLLVPVIVGDIKGEIRGAGEARHDMVLRALWNQLGSSIVIPLAKEIPNHLGISGIILEAKFDEKRYLVSSEPSVGTKQEMECVPGYRTQMVTRYRQVPYYETYPTHRLAGYRTENYTTTEQVYDPCKERRIVSKQFVKFDPKGSMTKEQSVAQYFLPLTVYDGNLPPPALYEKLSLLLIDSKGNQLKSQGSIPFPVTTMTVPKAMEKQNTYGGVTQETIYAKGDKSYAQGLAKKIQYFDDRKRIRKVENYSTDDLAAQSGVYKRFDFFDQDGNRERNEYYHTESKTKETGFFKGIEYYSKNGKNERVEAYYTESDMAKNGVYKVLGYFDSSGKIRERIFYDKQGNIIRKE